MKREIICPECAFGQRELFPTDNPYPGKYVKFIPGLAREDYFCDLCGDTIVTGQTCVAFSIWTNRIPYIAWEAGYIKIPEEQCNSKESVL